MTTFTLDTAKGLSASEVAVFTAFEETHSTVKVNVPLEEISTVLALEGLAQHVATKALVRVVPIANQIRSLEEMVEALRMLGVNEERVERLVTLADSGAVMDVLYRNTYRIKAYQAFVNRYVVVKFARKTMEQYATREVSFAYPEAFSITESGTVEVKAKYVSIMSVSESSITREMTKDLKKKVSIKMSSTIAGRYEEALGDDGREINDLRNIVYLSRTKVDEESLEDKLGLVITDIQKKMIDEGFVIVSEDGTRESVYYLQSTSSQSMKRDNTFLASEDEFAPVELLKALGHSPLHYAKTDGSTYSINVSKIPTREGLSGTNALKSHYLTSFVESMKGNHLEGGYYELISNKKHDNGQAFKILVVDDIDVINYNSDFTVLDGRKKSLISGKADSFVALPGKDNPIILPLSDGGGLIDAEIAYKLKSEVGHLPAFLQFRFAPYNKGIVNFLGGVKARTGYDIILPRSCVKGAIEQIDFESFTSEFAIASTNKRYFDSLSQRMVSNQTLNTMVVPLSNRMEKITEEFNAIENVLASDDMVAEYFGAKLGESTKSPSMFDSLDGNSDSGLFIRDLIQCNPAFSKDASVRANVYNTIERSMNKHYSGGQTLNARQVLLAQDPLLLLEVTAYNLAHPNNKITQITESDYLNFINADKAITVGNNGEFSDGTTEVLARNPSTNTDEKVIVETTVLDSYTAQRKRYDFLFEGMIVLSAFGITSYIMQGADFDGDQVTMISDYAESVKGALPTHPLINGVLTDYGLELGCPYESNNMVIPAFVHEGVTQDEWSLSFDKSIYTKELELKVHNFKKEFHKTKLVQSNVGIYTNMSVAVLDKLSSFAIYLETQNVSEQGRIKMNEAIKELEHTLKVVTLMVAWEIDKPKHGGAFMEHLDLAFVEKPHISLVAKDKYGEPVYHPVTGAARWFKPSWLTANPFRTKNMSNLQTTAVYAKERFAEIGMNDNLFDPTLGGNNLLSIMDEVPVPECEVFTETIREVFKASRLSYNASIKDAFETRENAIIEKAAACNIAPNTRAFFLFREEIIELTSTDFNKSIGALVDQAEVELRDALIEVEHLVPNEFIPSVVFGVIGYKTIHLIASKSLSNRRSQENPVRGTDLTTGFGYIRTVMKDFLRAVAEYTSPNRDLYFDPALVEERKSAPFNLRMVVSEVMNQRAEVRINTIKDKALNNVQLSVEEEFYLTLTPTQFVVHGFFNMVNRNGLEVKVVIGKDDLNQEAIFLQAGDLRLGRLFADQVARFSETETVVDVLETNISNSGAWFNKKGEAIKSFGITVRAVR